MSRRNWVVVCCALALVFAAPACSSGGRALDNGPASSSMQSVVTGGAAAARAPADTGQGDAEAHAGAVTPSIQPTDAAGASATSTATPGRGAASDGSVEASRPRAGCEPLSIDRSSMLDHSAADTYAWSDSRCSARTAALFRNDAVDGFGESGGYLRRLTYQAYGQQRTCTGTGQNNWYGFGYVVSHYGNADADTNTQGTLGSYSIVLAGRHHAIHEFTWSMSPGGPVAVTAQWFFATGRDHPLFAITFDATPAGPNAVFADARAPYGDIAWDNDTDGDVSGIAWGDAYKFTTHGLGPVTPASAWDYTVSNVIPYAMEWSNAADSEMGLVATQSWTSRVAGGDYGQGLLAQRWGQTGTNLLVDLPLDLWPFQLNQYELADETNSHRVAWGATFGAVGQTSYEAFGKTLSGYPYQSYSVFVVLGTHAASAVLGATQELESVRSTTLGATRGEVSTSGPAGIGRTDTAAYTPAGFDPVYGVWDAQLDGNEAATLTLTVGQGSLTNPIFRLHGYTASLPPASVTFSGRTLVADIGYFASVDPGTSSLWLTLNDTVVGAGTLTVDAALPQP